MQNPLLAQGGNGILPSLSAQGFDMNGRQIQLPSIGQIGQNLMLQPSMGIAMANPYMGITNIGGMTGQLPSINTINPFISQV